MKIRILTIVCLILAAFFSYKAFQTSPKITSFPEAKNIVVVIYYEGKDEKAMKRFVQTQLTKYLPVIFDQNREEIGSFVSGNRTEGRGLVIWGFNDQPFEGLEIDDAAFEILSRSNWRIAIGAQSDGWIEYDEMLHWLNKSSKKLFFDTEVEEDQYVRDDTGQLIMNYRWIEPVIERREISPHQRPDKPDLFKQKDRVYVI